MFVFFPKIKQEILLPNNHKSYTKHDIWRMYCQSSERECSPVSVLLTTACRVQILFRGQPCEELGNLRDRGRVERVGNKRIQCHTPQVLRRHIHLQGLFPEMLDIPGIEEKMERLLPEFNRWAPTSTLHGLLGRFDRLLSGLLFLHGPWILS